MQQQQQPQSFRIPVGPMQQQQQQQSPPPPQYMQQQQQSSFIENGTSLAKRTWYNIRPYVFTFLLTAGVMAICLGFWAPPIVCFARQTSPSASKEYQTFEIVSKLSFYRLLGTSLICGLISTVILKLVLTYRPFGLAT